MANKKTRRISPYADRMGRFIGQLRDHEGVTLEQLSKGLCALSYLNKVENGDREIGKQMTDAFFQRLGKPAELFERILDHEEFVKWTRRQEIIALLRGGKAQEAASCAETYGETASGVLDRQFLQIVDIDCRALKGASAEELLPLVRDALQLTQPDFGKVPFDTLLLSQNEGRLLFAHLQLRETIEGSAAVANEYRTLVNYFKHKRYESRERVYLFPYVACRVIENEFREGHFEAALSVCEDALAELTREKRLFAYDRLLDWKQKLFDAMGNPDKTPGKLLEQLRLILRYAPRQAELLVPCEEQGHVYCINQVIRDRRNLLGISQETLSEEACGARSVSRIENEERKVNRKNRKLLLRKVNMSGERYDYEIISDRYEDYLLRSELDRAITARETDKARELLAVLRNRIPDIPTNHQYCLAADLAIHSWLPKEHPDRTTQDDQERILKEAIKITLPEDIDLISMWETSVLSVNELMLLISYASNCRKQGNQQKSLTILTYIKRCLENAGTDMVFYEDLYTRVCTNIASILDDMGLQDEVYSLLSECIRISLETQNSRRLGEYLYGMACSLGQTPNDLLTDAHRNYIVSLLKQGYSAAVMRGDAIGQSHIYNYCLKKYGVEICL